MDTDDDWEWHVRAHPWFGVLAHPRCRGGQLPEALWSEAQRNAERLQQDELRWCRQLSELRGKSPGMQMNDYPLNTVMYLLQSYGVRQFFAEFTDRGRPEVGLRRLTGSGRAG